MTFLDENTLRHIGHVADIPFLEGRSVMVGDTRIAVLHTEQGFVAIGGTCPHQGGPLSDGIISAQCVTCPLHNWRIDFLSGEVVVGGEGRVPVFELIEHTGELYLRMPKDSAPPTRAAA